MCSLKVAKKDNLFLVACVLYFLMSKIFKFQLLAKMMYFIFFEYAPYYMRTSNSEYKLTKLILRDGYPLSISLQHKSLKPLISMI